MSLWDEKWEDFVYNVFKDLNIWSNYQTLKLTDNTRNYEIVVYKNL